MNFHGVDEAAAGIRHRGQAAGNRIQGEPRAARRPEIAAGGSDPRRPCRRVRGDGGEGRLVADRGGNVGVRRRRQIVDLNDDFLGRGVVGRLRIAAAVLALVSKIRWTPLYCGPFDGAVTVMVPCR